MGNFYSVISQNNSSENSSTFVVRINSEHALFKGHFPETPIVPGALLVQLSRELLELSLNKKVKLVEAKSIKFLKRILPNESPELKIDLSISRNEKIELAAEIQNKNSTCFKMKANYSLE